MATPAGQPRRAPPMGRALRILLGLALIAYVAPVYFRIPLRVVTASLLLAVGLAVAYGVILAIPSRFIGSTIGAVFVHALLVGLYVAGFSKLPIVGSGRGQLAAVVFLGVSLVVAGIRGLVGCELMAIPGAFFRGRGEVPCLMFSPLDKLERRLRDGMKIS